MKYLLLLLLAALAFASLVRAEDEPVDDGADAEAEEEEAAPSLFSEEEQAAIDANAEKFEFQAEVGRVMEIVIHSLYRNKEIFLRELISNSGDALDKVRFQSLTNKKILDDAEELEIKIKVDEDASTITITDTGVGMTRDELVKNLGTVARSGTAEFLDKIGSDDSNLGLIGQFGVGFYSAYLVADRVVVISKSHNSEDQYIWDSLADGSFSISKDPRGNTLGRGTQVILHIKEDSDNFLSNDELKTIAKRYSQFTTFPIKFYEEEEIEEEVEIEDDEADEADSTSEGDDDDELEATEEDEDEEKKPKTKTVTRTEVKWTQINEDKPIWLRSTDEITEEEYQSFYKALDSGEALDHTHFKAEGDVEFTSILFIPKTAPHDLYDRYYQQNSGLRLYVRKVLVNDDMEDLLPRYLNFVKGMVDSNDLPLNVNREQLQESRVMKIIGKKLTRNTLEMLRKMSECEDEDDEEDEDEDVIDVDEDEEEAEEKECPSYADFWEQFGKSIKLGIMEEKNNNFKKRLHKLLRFTSTEFPEDPISLESYIERAKEGQKKIYFIAGSDQETVERSTFLKKLTNRGYEVLFFVDTLDEYLMQHLKEFDDFKFQDITKQGLDLGDKSKAEKKYDEDLQEEFSDLMEWLKDVYGDSKVDKVVLSERLTDAPMGVVTDAYGWSANMERIMKAQAFGSGKGQKVKKTVEINARHPVIISLKDKSLNDPESDELKDHARLLFDAALISSGFSHEDGISFSERIERVIRHGLGIEVDAPVLDEPEFEADPEEEEEVEEEEEEEAEVEDDEAEAEIEDESSEHDEL